MKEVATPFKSLVINEDYEDFQDFFEVNKIHVYNAIFELFKNFLVSEENVLSLRVDAKINGLEWGTDFKFHVEGEIIVLLRDLLPFYIENEMYEKCAQIKDLYDKLDARNKMNANHNNY